MKWTFRWDIVIGYFTDDNFHLYWLPMYILDNIFTRFIYLVYGVSTTYFNPGTLEGYAPDV